MLAYPESVFSVTTLAIIAAARTDHVGDPPCIGQAGEPALQDSYRRARCAEFERQIVNVRQTSTFTSASVTSVTQSVSTGADGDATEQMTPSCASVSITTPRS
jgi:hypothetical protein